MSLIFIKKLVGMKFFFNIIYKKHIINEKCYSFTLVSKDLVIQEFFHKEYRRNNLYTVNKDL